MLCCKWLLCLNSCSIPSESINRLLVCLCAFNVKGRLTHSTRSYYSTSFFEGVIEDPLVGTTVVGAVNVLATYVAMRIMDSCGRRTLILWSSGGMFLCCVMIVMSLLGFLSNVLAFVAVCFYVTFFELGLGPIPWLVVSEMVSRNSYRGYMLRRNSKRAHKWHLPKATSCAQNLDTLVSYHTTFFPHIHNPY